MNCDFPDGKAFPLQPRLSPASSQLQGPTMTMLITRYNANLVCPRQTRLPAPQPCSIYFQISCALK